MTRFECYFHVSIDDNQECSNMFQPVKETVLKIIIPAIFDNTLFCKLNLLIICDDFLNNIDTLLKLFFLSLI